MIVFAANRAAPHGVHVDDAFAIVTAGTVSGRLDEPSIELARRVDRTLARAVREGLRNAGLPAVG